jgi:feruloyl esterase
MDNDTLFDVAGVRDVTVQSATVTSSPSPQHCRVEAYIKPAGTTTSNIGIEIRMPLAGWNGKFLALGGGGWAGVFSNATTGLSRGYATGSTDTGHKAGDPTQANWQLLAPGIPNSDAMEDFNWRSMQQMTIVGKQMVQAFYDDTIDYSYWQGCSTGGRQGMKMSQLFPDFFDGIIIGAPVFQRNLHVNGIWRNSFTTVPGVFLTDADLELVNDQVLARFDAADGVVDGFVTDPLEIKNWDADDIVGLPPEKVRIFDEIYKGARQSDGTQVYPGYAPAGELGWDGPTGFDPNSFGAAMIRNLVYYDPTYDILDWNIDTDLDDFLASPQLQTYSADNPDIRPFIKNGGKIIYYHGWNDDGPNPLATLDYYNAMEEIVGKDKDLKTGNPGNPADRVRESARLFLAPGMDHCGGGPGVAPSAANLLLALESWVEDDDAPERIIARNNSRNMERPLCAYPKVASYIGQGDTNDADNFVCVQGNGKGAGSQGR